MTLHFPSSLKGQFRLVFISLITLIIVTGTLAGGLLRHAAEATEHLGAEHLNAQQQANRLQALTLQISSDTAHLLAKAEARLDPALYRHIQHQLDEVDNLLPLLASNPQDVDAIGFYQASQQYRATVNIVLQLRQALANSRAELVGSLDAALQVLARQHREEAMVALPAVLQLEDLQSLKAWRGKVVPLAGEAPAVLALFSLAEKRVQQQALSRTFAAMLDQQRQLLLSAASRQSRHYQRQYQAALGEVQAKTRLGAWIVIGLTVLSVLLYLAFVFFFLGRHVLGRLNLVSNHLRQAGLSADSSKVPVSGRDEVGEMARAVERFLAERWHLALTRKALDEEHQYLQAVIHQSGDGILVVDEQSYCHEANNAALQLLGLARDALWGLPLIRCLPFSVRERRLRLLQRYLRRQGLRPSTGLIEMCIERPDGVRVLLEVTVGAITTQGRPMAVLALRDITARRQHAQQLAEARLAAEASLQQQTAFLANMSHEIRTPLNAMIGFTELLRQSALDAVQSDYLRRVDNASHHLLGILNDILDFSKIEAGKISPERIGFSLSALLDRVISIFWGAARQKGLELEQSLEGAEVLVYGDPMRLTQILPNLLSNAVKFTAKGSIRLQVEVRPAGPEEVSVWFQVADTGVGMPPASLARLFLPFSQADASTTRRFGGTGLGLAISHALVALMGGELHVESQLEQGTRFHFTLPMALASQDELQADSVAEADQVACRGLRVLLVEDNLDNQLVGQELLGRCGIAVALANNGLEALAYLQREKVDLVLMDIHMPELDGFETTRRLRQIPALTHLPVIAMTAAATVQDKEKCLAAGMNDHVGKPFELPKLLATLARWTGVHADTEIQVALPLQPEPDAKTSPWPASLPGIECAQAIQKLGGKQALYQRLVGLFLQNYADLCAALRQAEGLPPEERLRRVHSLVSSAAVIGADDLSQLARDYEQHLSAGTEALTAAEPPAVLCAELSRVLTGLQSLALTWQRG